MTIVLGFKLAKENDGIADDGAVVFTKKSTSCAGGLQMTFTYRITWRFPENGRTPNRCFFKGKSH